MRLKELTEEGLNKLSIVQLYNILFGPIVDKFKYNELNGESIGAVYGASIVPIKRRNNALKHLLEEIPLDSVVFSGGVSWTGKADETTFKRTRELMNKLPEVEKAVVDKMGEESFYQEYFRHREVICSRMFSDVDYFNFLINEYEKRPNPNMKFDFWLTEFIFKNAVSYLIHYDITEAEIFDIDWKSNYKDSRINNTIYEDESLNTADNAINTLKKYIKRKKENNNVNSMIIISEWPYLLRAILTTINFSKKYNIPVTIAGYPANYSDQQEWYYSSIEEFYNNSSTGVLPNIKKMIKYDDVGDMDITEYLEMDHLIEGGPSITIGDKPLSLYIDEITPKI